MHLLSRAISEYTDNDQCLGVFRTLDEATEARTQYIAALESAQRTDPWPAQAYHTVDLSQDVRVLSDIPANGVSAQTAVVYVVSLMAEGFGQIVREYKSIHGSADAAAAAAASLDENDAGDMEYSHVDAIAIGCLRWSPASS